VDGHEFWIAETLLDECVTLENERLRATLSALQEQINKAMHRTKRRPRLPIAA
jgi:hypothetical protein